MRLGLGCEEITPGIEQNLELDGYIERKGAFEGIHLPLYVKGFVIKVVNSTICLITLDLLALTEEHANYIKGFLQRELNIDKSDILLCCSHTHSAPAIRDIDSEAKQRYFEFICEKIVSCCKTALENLRDVQMVVEQWDALKIGKSRLENIEAYTPLTVISFFSKDILVAALINYPCHPTVLSHNNRRVSSDWPGVMCEEVKKYFSDRILVGYLNGASGDISTRFTRREQTLVEVERLGKVAASVVINLIKESKHKLREKIEYNLARESFVISPEPKTNQLEIRDIDMSDESRISQSIIEGLKAVEGEYLSKETSFTINLLTINDFAMVAIPGELFSTLGELISQRSPYKRTMVVGYCNGYMGYIPDNRAFRNLTYEAIVSQFDEGAGEFLVNEVVGYLEKLKGN